MAVAAKPPVAKKPAAKTPTTENKTAAMPKEKGGLSPNKKKVLKAMAGGEIMNYRDIEAKTGLYKNLTPLMRKKYEGSLVDLGLVKEIEKDVAGKKQLFFQITAAGKKAATKA